MLRSRVLRHLAVTFAGLGLLTTVQIVRTASPAGATGSVTVAAAEEYDLLAVTNSARASAGLGVLSDDLAARDVARAWAVWMASNRTLAHNGNLVAQVTQQVTPYWTHVGENVGEGPSVSALEASFLASPEHRANIFGDYNRIGVGAARDIYGVLWVSVVFVKGPAIPYVPPSSWAPYYNPYSLTNQQYTDFLGHVGAADGVDYWATLLRTGWVSTPNELDGFLRCPESVAEVAPVVRLYYAYFLRAPDYPGLSYWLGAVRGGMPASWVSDNFAGSQEFRNMYGSLSNPAFVDLVYDNVLHRPPDPEGKDYWLRQLSTGQSSRGDVMLGFSESAEYKVDVGPEVDVTMTYTAMLHRAADSAGYNYWVGQLGQGVSVEALMAAILDSPEYINRVT